jgi:DNA repair protein RecN (Recombination protein N)
VITYLAIKNYALIEDIRVELHEGLTIITGETGAGKSILLGALGLLLGKRADLSSVKDASKKCIIEGEFSIGAFELQPVFEQNEIDFDYHTIIRREILPSGKSRAFINDSPVSLSQLQALAVYLVDIHSQHETLSLISESFQLDVIDVLAGTQPILDAYHSKLMGFRTISSEISNLLLNKEGATKELDYNTFLYNELLEANLDGVKQTELEETFETLNNSEVIQESLSQISQYLTEEPIGTLETAKEARITLGKLRGFSTTYEDVWNRLNSVIIELEDIYEGIQQLAQDMDADPSKLFETNEKLQALYKLQQKHSVGTVEELLEIQKDLAAKIDNIVNLDDRISVLEKERSMLQEQVLTYGIELHEKREKAIPKLKEQLETYLKELGLPNAQFKFNLERSDNFRSSGLDTLELLFTANKGLGLGLLKKVASGGEMSRIMLAVKAVLARYKKLPTIIFDEIDAGVSGEIANKMAVIMSEMSQNMQLLTITHLAQIAAKGENHLKVYKEDVNEITQTRLKNLVEDERIVEIAQMISGNNITDAALANAKELLN